MSPSDSQSLEPGSGNTRPEPRVPRTDEDALLLESADPSAAPAAPAVKRLPPVLASRSAQSTAKQPAPALPEGDPQRTSTSLAVLRPTSANRVPISVLLAVGLIGLIVFGELAAIVVICASDVPVESTTELTAARKSDLTLKDAAPPAEKKLTIREVMEQQVAKRVQSKTRPKNTSLPPAPGPSTTIPAEPQPLATPKLDILDPRRELEPLAMPKLDILDPNRETDPLVLPTTPVERFNRPPLLHQQGPYPWAEISIDFDEPGFSQRFRIDYPSPGMSTTPGSPCVIFVTDEGQGVSMSPRPFDLTALRMSLNHEGYIVVQTQVSGLAPRGRSDRGAAYERYCLANAGLTPTQFLLHFARASHGVDPHRVFILSDGTGAGLALLAASHLDGIRGCVLMSPSLSLQNHWPFAPTVGYANGMPTLPALELLESRISPLTHIARIKCPVAIIETLGTAPAGHSLDDFYKSSQALNLPVTKLPYRRVSVNARIPRELAAWFTERGAPPLSAGLTATAPSDPNRTSPASDPGLDLTVPKRMPQPAIPTQPTIPIRPANPTPANPTPAIPTPAIPTPAIPRPVNPTQPAYTRRLDAPLPEPIAIQPAAREPGMPWNVVPDPLLEKNVYSLAANENVFNVGTARLVNSLTPSPYLAVIPLEEPDGFVQDLRTGTVLWKFENTLRENRKPVQVSLSPDGNRVAINAHLLFEVAERPSGDESVDFKIKPDVLKFVKGFLDADSLLGRMRASDAPEHVLWVYNTRHGTRQSWNWKDEKDYPSVAVSPTGKYLATWSSEQGVKIWSPTERVVKGILPAVSVYPMRPRLLAFSPDGKSLAGYQLDNSYVEILMWDLRSGQHLGGWRYEVLVPQDLYSGRNFFEWHPGSGGWRLASYLIDRRTGRMLGQIKTLPFNSDQIPRRLISRDQVLLSHGGYGWIGSRTPAARVERLPASAVPADWVEN